MNILRTGSYLKGDLIVKLFQEELEKKASDQVNGWVIDGFPQNMEHVSALKAAGLLPKNIAIIKNGSLRNTKK